MIRIAEIGAEVLFRRNRTKAKSEAIVFGVEMVAGPDDLLFGSVIEPRAKHIADSIANADQRANSGLHRSAESDGFQRLAVAND